jgi:hypothetical protein
MKPARATVVVLNEPWRRVSVEMVDDFLIADMDLALFDQRRNRNNHGKFFRIPFEVVDHGDDCPIVVPGQDDLRSLVKDLRVGLGDVKAAKAKRRLRSRAQDKRYGQE